MIQNTRVLIIPLIVALVAFIFIGKAVEAIIGTADMGPMVNLGIGIAILGFAGVFGKSLQGSHLTTIIMVAIIFISLGLLL